MRWMESPRYINEASIDKVKLTFQESAKSRAEDIFSVLDFNGDGQLEEDEFLSGCLNDDELISLLNAGGLEDSKD